MISRSANPLCEHHSVSVKSGSVGNTRLLPRAKIAACSNEYLLLWVDYICSVGLYILTEQTMLPLVSWLEVVTRILIFCGYCFWSA